MKLTREFSVSYKRIALVVLLIAVIIIYFLLYNKWEKAWTQAILKRGYNEGFTNGVSGEPASVLKATDAPIGYQGIEDGSYTADTITENMLLYINPILGGVLNQINKKTGARYFLRKIDRVNVSPISKGFIGCEMSSGPGNPLKSACPAVDDASRELQLGVRYTVDFFAHELTNQDTHRFIVIFVINSNGEVQVEHFNIANGQLHPDKMFQAANDLQGADTLAKPGNLILTDKPFGRDTVGNASIMGVPTSSLDFAKFRPEGAGGWSSSAQMADIFIPQFFQANNITPRPHPNQSWPSRKHGKWWDEFGVANVESTTDQRRGLDHAVEVRPLQNYDNPTVVRSEGDAWTNENHWLFDRARGSLRQASQI